MRTFQTLQELHPLVGQEVAVSDWTTITQEQVNRFADATGDHQWIHIDQQRAKDGPFGATIAHGFLTLSLLPMFFESAVRFEQTRMAINYGLNRLRFPAPVPVDSEIQFTGTLNEVRELDGGLQAIVAFEIAGAGQAEAFRFLKALRMCVPATTLGDVYTLVVYPPMSTHRALTPEQRAAIGISDGLVRVSVGIEDVADIIADLDQAMS